MNALLARLLLTLFCATVGLFHFAKGISELRSHQGSRLFGGLRIVLAVVLFSLPLAFWLLTGAL